MARGHQDGALGLSTDATFRSPVRLREVLENLPALVLVLDRKGRIRYVNHDSLGAGSQVLLGSHGLRHVAPEFRESCRRAFRSALACQQVQVFEIRDVRGRWWETRLVPVVRDRELAAIGICADVTARKEAEETLRESEQKLRTISNAALDAVVMMDPQGNVAHWNPAAERMFGYAQEEIVGRNLHQLLAPERYRPLAKKGLLAFAQFGEGYVVGKVIELEAVRKDGTEFPIELSVSPVQIQANGPWWAVAIIRDVTQRKHTERSLREKEAHLLAAQEIQSRLWPESLETLPGYDVAGASYPAAFAGGDCFDFIPMSDGTTGLVVGDVSGHGLGTALLTALTQAHLRSLAEMHTSLREILVRTNRCLAKETDHFVTLFFGCLAPEAHTFRYVNAGHPPGYVLDRSGAVKRRLENTALPLAVSAETEFVEGDPVTLEPGDMIVLLSDGVQEAFSPTDELFGIARALKLLRAHRRKTARQLIEILYRAIREFAGGRELQDDMTAVIVRVLAEGPPRRARRSVPRRDSEPDPGQPRPRPR